MKTGLIIILSFIIVACSRFNQDHFLSESFGADLRSLASSNKTEYSDSLFLVFDVSNTDPIYSHFFTKPYETESVTISFGDTQFNSSEVGVIQYQLLESFDGYTKTIFYIPKQKLMGFGYANSLL